MSNIALINGGIVENIIVADIGFASGLGYELVVDVTDMAQAVIGASYFDGIFTPPEEPPAGIDVCANFIDIGPFFDRFGAYLMPILMSTDATVKALIQNLQVRKWIDITRPDVSQAVDVIVAKGLIPAGMKATVLYTPVSHTDNLALRKLYFS